MLTYLQPEDDGLPMRLSGDWATEKLDYLRRYIDVFETSMRNKWDERNYIDLFTGPGKNHVRETGLILLGSPLIALNTRYPFTGYFFIDSSEEYTFALDQRCINSQHYSNIVIRSGDCNVLIDDIFMTLKKSERSSLNLAFLDPEGLELQWSTVAKLASVRRMDLIIHYSQTGLNRAMPDAFESNEQTMIDRFFGGLEWREIYKKYKRREEQFIHRQLMDLYKKKLHALGYAEVLRDDETNDEPLIRNAKRNSPLYRLLFASKHPLGHEFWQKITGRDVYGQRRLF